MSHIVKCALTNILRLAQHTVHSIRDVNNVYVPPKNFTQKFFQLIMWNSTHPYVTPLIN